jgi:hypothetical protein
MNARLSPKKLISFVAIERSAASRPTKEMKARQNSKVRKIGQALRAAGFLTVGQQAKALGLCRSTTFSLFQGNHKSSGLSPAVINRMLATPKLPRSVRTVILEYVEEKCAGLYGHSRDSLRRFTASLVEEQRPRKPRLALLAK